MPAATPTSTTTPSPDVVKSGKPKESEILENLWSNDELVWKRVPVVGLVLNGPGEFKDNKTGEVKPYGSVKVHVLVKLPVPYIGRSFGGGGVMYEIPLMNNPHLSFDTTSIDNYIRYLSSTRNTNPIIMMDVGFSEVINKDSNKKNVERVSQQTPVDIRLPVFPKLDAKN